MKVEATAARTRHTITVGEQLVADRVHRSMG